MHQSYMEKLLRSLKAVCGPTPSGPPLHGLHGYICGGTAGMTAQRTPPWHTHIEKHKKTQECVCACELGVHNEISWSPQLFPWKPLWLTVVICVCVCQPVHLTVTLPASKSPCVCVRALWGAPSSGENSYTHPSSAPQSFTYMLHTHVTGRHTHTGS